MNKTHIKQGFAIVMMSLVAFFACKPEEEITAETRLFRPVLNKELSAKNNTIIVNMGNIKAATGYTVEVSRDTFKTTDYTFKVDTNYVIVDETLLKGESLYWNTTYQVRAIAHAAKVELDSKVSDLGSVKTEKFPSIMATPTAADVIDVAARIRWTTGGVTVAKVKVFAKTDLKLATPLAQYNVSEADQKAGSTIVSKLNPLTTYQLAIYAADGTIKGWDNFTTISRAVDTSSPNVIDLSENDDPTALNTALLNVVEGGIIVLKKGATYTMPVNNFAKSVTITSAYGFGEQKTIITTSGGGNIATGVTLDYIRFSNIEFIGADIGGSYIFNPNIATLTTVKELSLDNCIASNMRGLLRIRGKFFATNFIIKNSIIHQIGTYGVLTTDTDGAGNAAVDNIIFQKSTFSKINIFLTSRQNSNSVLIEDCTLSEVATNSGSLFNWRGAAGLRNVTNGIKISNCIWGHAWDQAVTAVLAVRGKSAGLDLTNITVLNTYTTGDFSYVAGTEISGLPSFTYTKKASELWVSPYTGLNFNFKDTSFPGRKDTGDPRWRVK
ncbi:DUF5123 domain-containing protein [Arcicella lustrica]|uniref:DUF5123 domain-containing protein n=1 Tax=Arcicella lustrica TaxID=2984196 RepID=A0ABU5SFY6_9BACT|nr:DUF5123 domain-containing protein [Arcicella sp. DC25W]MEA5426193.1 DUF5123 domain-containing protein [Arcicella sp. DC25W]